jgi:hypothetical protein
MECDISCEVYCTRSEHVTCRRIQCKISHELRELSHKIDIGMFNVKLNTLQRLFPPSSVHPFVAKADVKVGTHF